MAPRHRPGNRRPLGRLANGVLLAVVVAVLVSCSDGGSTPGAAGTSSAVSSTARASVTPSPTSAAEVASSEAVAAYLGMWRATAVASHTSDWQSPELSRYASGAALQVITGTLYADRFNKVVSRGQSVNQPTVTSADPPAAPTTVLLADCGDDSGWQKYHADPGQPDDGQLVAGSSGGRRQITAEVRLHQDGAWRVTRFAVGSVGSC
ncbi:hypothetical protein FF36_04544 [Frankia torreyi]|uniref:Secreted protein/lipoprotein n=1 Tax=Frankia torreyi TaxID=1856 RepID=A0A0D8BB90_9ACTN|nr:MULTISPECIES: hypothetical protein [Frankia]KJE21204.1 hypothetical protein FF36_04544 [Frankia torreyi]KQM06419.1 hypothetical protein FF86_10082 [Frankia sp. CpI1-P]